MTIFIDAPLDVAMARRIVRDFKESSSEQIVMSLENYLIHGRKGYLNMLDTIKPNSDIIIDGTLSSFEVSAMIAQKIKRLKR